jgi:hypothetical protein
MAKKGKLTFLQCLKYFILAVAATVLINFALAYIGEAIRNDLFGDEPNVLWSCFRDLVSMAVYALLLYTFSMRHRIFTYATHTEKMDVKQEILAFIRADGKYFFIIYAVCAFIRILSDVMAPGPLLLVRFFLSDMAMTSIFTYLKLPDVLSSLLACIYACAMVCLLALIRSRKIHRDDTTAKAR